MKFKKLIYLLLLIMIIGLIVYFIFCSSNKATITNSANQNTNVSDNENNVTKDNSIENQNANSNVTEITESYFMTTINDIYINYQDYVGKEVEYEGFVYFPEKDGYSMVVGRNYNCCGYDAFVIGFECKTDEQLKADTWVKVKGTVAVNNSNPNDIYPYLNVTSIEEKETRGAETVYN